MYKIQVLNNISEKGLALLDGSKYEIAEKIDQPDAILVRSFKMNDMELPTSLKAIARAGAGVNNIPVTRCTEKGIVVFNTPGANANSVKELVISALFLASRRLYDAITWAKSLAGKGEEVVKLIEKGKAQFVGPEIKGKRLGVIGLGAIGSMVANDALALGMEVVGYDPYISIEAAWGLSREVKRAKNLEGLLAEVDYLTLHTPLTEETKGFLDNKRFAQMKKGIILLNFARGELINSKDLLEALQTGILSCYVTDFPDDALLSLPQVIPIPHLGASTPEAEENCAVMACRQLKDFLENGNIVNSVNFPNCEMQRTGDSRILIANKNIPKMINLITNVLAEKRLNISEMINRHKNEVAYNIIDVDGKIDDTVVENIKKIEGILMVRVI